MQTSYRTSSNLVCTPYNMHMLNQTLNFFLCTDWTTTFWPAPFNIEGEMALSLSLSPFVKEFLWDFGRTFPWTELENPDPVPLPLPLPLQCQLVPPPGVNGLILKSNALHSISQLIPFHLAFVKFGFPSHNVWQMPRLRSAYIILMGRKGLAIGI